MANIRNVLIIDDSKLARVTLSRLLKAKDYNISEAASVDEGLEILRNEPIDAAFIDVQMPEKDGFVALETIKNDPDLAHLPCSMYSGDTSNESHQSALEKGADAYLFKPANADSVDNVLQALEAHAHTLTLAPATETAVGSVEDGNLFAAEKGTPETTEQALIKDGKPAIEPLKELDLEPVVEPLTDLDVEPLEDIDLGVEPFTEPETVLESEKPEPAQPKPVLEAEITTASAEEETKTVAQTATREVAEVLESSGEETRPVLELEPTNKTPEVISSEITAKAEEVQPEHVLELEPISEATEETTAVDVAEIDDKDSPAEPAPLTLEPVSEAPEAAEPAIAETTEEETAPAELVEPTTDTSGKRSIFDRLGVMGVVAGILAIIALLIWMFFK